MHNDFLRAILDELRRIGRYVAEILRFLEQDFNRYTIRIQEIPMALGNITAGTTGQFGATLLDNGTTYVAPSGSTYVFAPTFTSSDATVTFAAATTDASGGTIPLADQTVVSVPGSDQNTSLTITATALAPDGTTVTNSITVALTPGPQQFTIAVAQLA